jgi:hypothetical protein
MTDRPTDDGVPIDNLRIAAWVLGVVAIGSLVRLLLYAGDGTPVQTELFVWVLLGSVSAAFSTGCFVLVGVKAAEVRLVRQARALH